MAGLDPGTARASRDGGVTSRAAAAGARLAEMARQRRAEGERFFPAQAERIARLSHLMAERFARGGRLFAIGRSPAGCSDAHHLAVEFVHPAIVGKRALPALALGPVEGPIAEQLALLARPQDIVVAVELDDGETAESLRFAARRGCLTIALSAAGAEWSFAPEVEDPFARQELIEALYHITYELVHVFFEHHGLLGGRSDAPAAHGGSAFLYPFLAPGESDLEAVIADARDSVLMKAEEIATLREQTLTESRDSLLAAAVTLRHALDDDGVLLAFGNGGSATDAMDVVADFRMPPDSGGLRSWPPRRALDLTQDPAVLTAIANDIGVDSMFARQVIAYGRRGDVVLALSTSGNSANVVRALIESRRRGLRTIAMVGYDGGRVALEGLADHLIVVRSENIPRIQEAQATACHALRELVEWPDFGTQ